ncbi:hypothetical protein FD755_008449 [Muntiacus reevesi]|uniref:Zinc finger E-box binding homeobox 2 n=1 Tax=Muntiacus reevesi TaxID=9886 RepID=A0A5J5MJR0_MUNRE|nr:hypothetical protein FD755_008449 [Muntiacus reevesi]
MTHFEDIEPACCRSRAPSPCELPSDPLLSMKQPIMADGPRCKRRKQANPRRKNETNDASLCLCLSRFRVCSRVCVCVCVCVCVLLVVVEVSSHMGE